MEEKSKIIVCLFNLEQHLEVYYKTIEEHLDCPSWVRKRYMMLLKNDIADYLDMNPDATMDDICQLFGDPFEPNNALLRKVEREYMARLRKQLIFCYCLIGVLSITLILMIYVLIHSLHISSLDVRVTNILSK